jgi:PIN domain nuclease of toxin-antitoxin system
VKLLADTHAFLWFALGDDRLSPRARSAMEDADGEWCLSAASVWEMAIKSSLGRLELPKPAPEYFAGKVRQGLRIAPVEWSHAALVERLPFHHRDPFDRLIIAQALVDRLTVVTRDPVFGDYGVAVVW